VHLSRREGAFVADHRGTIQQTTREKDEASMVAEGIRVAEKECGILSLRAINGSVEISNLKG
jgi:hypothetical protein